MAPPRAVVLVTGCSSGIGRASVERLRRAGALVVATARDLASLQDIAEPGHVEVARLDVTSAADRAAVVEGILARHGRIDALVNNAGFGATLAVEETPLDEMRAMFDVNLFGLHELTRLALPQMRRQGHGRIVNVSSVAGHVAVPLIGAYCATKFALRALTQALDSEVRHFGIRAVLVEPGPITTRFGERSMAESRRWQPSPEASPYAAMYRTWERRRGKRWGSVPADRVARKVVHACLAASPRNHYFVPASASGASLAKRLLPDAWVQAGMRMWVR